MRIVALATACLALALGGCAGPVDEAAAPEAAADSYVNAPHEGRHQARRLFVDGPSGTVTLIARR